MTARDIVAAGPRKGVLVTHKVTAEGEEIPANCPYWNIDAIISHTEIGRRLDHAAAFFDDTDNEYGKRAVLLVRQGIQKPMADLYDERVTNYLRGCEKPLMLGKGAIKGSASSTDKSNSPRDVAIEKLEQDLHLIVAMHVPGFFERGAIDAKTVEPLVDNFISQVDAFIPNAFARAMQARVPAINGRAS